MKKCQKALLTLTPSFLMLALAIPVASGLVPAHDEAGEDTALYDTDLTHARLEAPNLSSELRDEDDDPVTVEVDKVILHYYNEAGGCDGRAFYIWATGVDGMEYSDDAAYEQNVPSAVNYSADGKMMTLTMDFINDSRFSFLQNRSGLWFIIKFKRQGTNLNWGGQSDDMFLRFADYESAINDKVCEVWTMPAAGGGIAILDMEEKTRVPGIKLATFTDWNTIKCDVSKESNNIWWKLYAFDETYYRIKPKKREAAKKKYLVKEEKNQVIPASKSFEIKFKYEIHPNIVYSLESHDPASDVTPGMDVLNKVATVGFTTLYDSAKFHKYYEFEYDSTKTENSYFDNLGMTYTKESTTFKVWAPMSANITLMIYNDDTSAEYDGGDKYKGYHMHYTKGGIWQLTVDGDLNGKYYNYQVDNTLGTNVAMDPYATSAGACGLRGYIYDINGAESKPEGWDELATKWSTPGYDIDSPQDLSIYEVHVQDFTGDESWVSSNTESPTKRGTYDAFVEKGTKVAGTSISTGYDHLNELGVKAVQLMPMFDHDNDERPESTKFNWGYNPLNYNVVEGAYSSNSHDGLARVKEFRNLVLGMSQTEVHTRVIMDVVYNHVSSATGSAFHKLMPRYYFRYAGTDYYYIKDVRGDIFGENGNYYYYESGTKKKVASSDVSKLVKYQSEGELFDGSGCHNEVASDRRMMRKFIVDSLVHWAKDFQVKGFRFDLMGLLDFETMNTARKALYEVDPDIYMYGEGWTSGGYHGDGTLFWDQSHPTESPRSEAVTGKGSGNFSTETWQVYHNCNNWSYGNYVYLGGFNDAYRNGMRGGNDSNGTPYPGSGFIQSTHDGHDNGVWAVAQGLWGANDDKKGFYPEQTVNYVSCHDNYTLRDQLYNTIGGKDNPTIAEDLLRASIASHAITMAGNSAAFMLGGEELLRTKELTPADVAQIDKTVNANDVVNMYGHNISHNSYNLSLECNSFKWGNKVEVNVDGTKVTDAEYHYNEKFQTIVKLHNLTTKKRGMNLESYKDTEKYDVFVKETTTGKHVENACWGNGDYGAWDGSSSIAMQTNLTFVYINLNNSEGYVWGDKHIGASTNAWTSLFEYGYGTYDSGSNKMHLQNKFAIKIYNSNGYID